MQSPKPSLEGDVHSESIVDAGCPVGAQEPWPKAKRARAALLHALSSGAANVVGQTLRLQAMRPVSFLSLPWLVEASPATQLLRP